MQAETGIRILAALRCTDDGATACLRILKILVHRLSHTVDFNFDQIEASTTRLCRSEMTDTNTLTPTFKASGLLIADIMNPEPPVPKQNSAVPLSQILWQDDSLMATSRMESAAQSPLANSSYWDADELLAQANEISLAHSIEDFVNLEW